MSLRALFAPVPALVLWGCGTATAPDAPTPATSEEAQALEEAASMLDPSDLPPGTAPQETTAPDNQTSGEIR